MTKMAQVLEGRVTGVRLHHVLMAKTAYVAGLGSLVDLNYLDLEIDGRTYRLESKPEERTMILTDIGPAVVTANG